MRTTFLQNAEAVGWKFVEPNGYVIDFVKLLREAAADGQLTLYGVRIERGTQAELDGPRVRIPSEHWHEFQVDALSCFHVDPKSGLVDRVAADNFQTQSYLLPHKTGYVNLHVAASKGEQWIRGSLVPLKEAATRAYERTRGRVSAGLAEQSGDSPLTWYCYALWQRIPIYGSYPPSRFLEEIPDEDKKRYSFHMEGGEIVLRQHSGKGGYDNLHVRGHMLSEAIRGIAALP